MGIRNEIGVTQEYSLNITASSYNHAGPTSLPLTPGSRVGPYEIATQIGVGGMGEMYRARDTKLGRDVAIKVLPATLTNDADRLVRFQREAQVLAALNHPNIAAIHHVEETSDGPALVMELVEGETLADRIARGPIPIDETLPIAKQIAAALEAAHEQGIIHRDLKPGNIKVRDDGTVKVLDFGLAKLAEAPAGSTASPNAASLSPTITSPALMTGVGVLLGTAAYMSPEQARGKAVNKRADIWAFGCVLYEMLTGKPAFDGEDVSVVLASVIKGEPDWTALTPDVPRAIVELIRGCLEKDGRKRVGDIGAATFVLNHIDRLGVPVAASQSAAVRVPLWRRATPIAAGITISALLTGGAVWLLTRPSRPVVRVALTTSGSTALLPSGSNPDISVTPDGSRIIYRGNRQLLVRSLNQLEPAVLGNVNASQGALGPFVSPDGRWIGFFDGTTTLKKVAITGGPPVTIAGVGDGEPRGATWGPDGTIIFATGASQTGLQRISASGGSPTVLTKPGRDGDHLWPEFLPGGKAVLFTIAGIGNVENAQIAVLDLQTGTTKVLIRGGSHAHYVPTGHLVYGSLGTLQAVAFDLGRLEVVGTPTPVLEGVLTMPGGAADFVVSSNGSLVYVQGNASAAVRNTIMSVDRQGHASALPGLPPDAYRYLRMSPDGTRLALATDLDVWTYDFNRATLSRLTTNPASDTRPLWTPDGQRVVFTSDRAGYLELYWRPGDGAGSDERLLTRAKDLIDLRAENWSPDGKQLLLVEVSSSAPRVECVIEEMPVERPSTVKILVKNDFCNDHPAISPDGHWMAYQSSLSGRNEIYTERYPELGDRQQISTEGGRNPFWSGDGHELFFETPDFRHVLAVSVQSARSIVFGRPHDLFNIFTASPSGGGNRPIDIAPDGRFLIISGGQADGDVPPSNIVLVQNWTEELKRLVPSN